MQIITKACGTVKRTDPMNWPSREEISSTSSARSVFAPSISHINSHTQGQTFSSALLVVSLADLLVKAFCMFFDFLFLISLYPSPH